MNQYDHIRKNLKEYHVPVDKDKLWANTAHAIPQKRKKRGAFFLLLGGALLISTAATFYALSTSEDNITTYSKIQSTSNPTANIPDPETIHQSNPATTENTIATSPAQVLTQEQVSNANTKIEHSNPQASATKTSTPSSGSQSPESIELSQHSDYVEASTPITITNEPSIPAETRGASSSANPDIATTETVSNQPSGENIPEPVVLENIPEARNATDLTNDIPDLPFSELVILTRETSPSDIVATQAKNKNRIGLVLMQGYGWTTMDMNTTNPELTAVVNEWEGKITSLENLSTSFHAVWRWPKGIQLSSGLQYSKLSTQMEYVWTTGEDFTEEGITTIIIDENGNYQNLIGDVEVHRETQVLSTRYSTQTRLDLELMLQIALIRSYRMETGVWLKGGYNLVYASSGTTFTADDPLYSYTTDENPYSLQTPFTFGAGIGTLYRLSPQWTINARLGYERLRYTHGLFDNDIQFAHNIFSLSLGTGYTF